MKTSRISRIGTLAIFAIVLGVGAISALAKQASPWNRCCGTTPWSWPNGMTGDGVTGGGIMGNTLRHRYAMLSGIPAPYTSLSNPLPRSRKTVDRGSVVYERNCSTCHGASGLGDGPASPDLSPRPANLAWLAQMPMSQWDALMFWSVSEGGSQFGTAMPAFKDTLSKDDRWAVIAYIQARLPSNR